LAVADPQSRAVLRQMAIAWINLANQAERRPPMGLDFDKLTPDQRRRALDD
jgi:hypothetical protein